jgi:prepilin-type N-terminal cleavage/methylation domain-containing protein
MASPAITLRPTPLGPSAGAGGFTLVEMLAALAILLIGVTTLLSSLGDSIALRRSTDARLQVAQAIDELVVHVQQAGLARRAGGETDLDLELAVPAAITLLGGIDCKLHVEANPERLDLLLLHVEASWLDQGELVREEFLRVLRKELPLAVRIQRFRSENSR